LHRTGRASGLKLGVNCFYSNRIEGNSTHPKELLKTQEKGHVGCEESSTDSILELLSHLEAQIKTKKASLDLTNVCTQDFIKDLH
jgi:Fic family protein